MNKVANYIYEHQLLPPNGKVLVAISGGADSVALLHILHSLGYNCIAAHCNFHLRGNESLRDQHFVTLLCSQLNIPLFCIDFQTADYAKQKRISIEMAARELRYQWFEQLRLQHQCHAIAVAHHKNDQAETILLNLKRGTGIRGLEGMKPKNNFIIRPLLCLNKQEIYSYLTLQHLNHVEDSTNSDTQFQRNNIRQQISQYSTAQIDNICTTASLMQDYEKIINQYITQNFSIQKTDSEHKIYIPHILQSIAPKTILYELLKDYSFTDIKSIYHSLSDQSGKHFLSPTHILYKDRDYLIIVPKNSCEDSSKSIKVSVIRNAEGNIIFPPSNSSTAFFDETITKKTLTLRYWEKGDYFCPIGMHGNKKLLSDFFTDMHLSQPQKQKVMLLCADQDIAWIIGYRIDERYKVTPHTQNIAQITIQ